VTATDFEYLTGKRVLVTGGGGFIGGHLVSRLCDEGVADVRAVDCKPLDEWHQVHEVDNLQLDLTEKGACDKAAEGAHIVFNLAADMGGMGFIEANKARCMLSVLINTHMLMAAVARGAERYFFSSSACVYAAGKQRDPDVTALREEDAYPAEPEDGYGWEKLFSERMCRHFSEDFGLPTYVARFHNVYGPHGTWNGGREKAPAAICRKVAEAKLSGDHAIQIWGDGRQTRSFMYVDDCIEGTLRLAGSALHDPVNVGSDELVTIDGLVDIVERIAGVRLDRRYDPGAPQGVRGRNSDNRAIRDRLGWAPTTPLADGLAATYHWIWEQVRAGARV
jgi:nucleoside-diphosphate-sugar epimerase